MNIAPHAYIAKPAAKPLSILLNEIYFFYPNTNIDEKERDRIYTKIYIEINV